MRLVTGAIRRPLLVGVVAFLIIGGVSLRQVGKAVATAGQHHGDSSQMAVSQHLDPTGSVARVKALVKTRIPAKGHVDSHPFIDGSVTPERIPTNVAYSFFLRVLTAKDASPSAAKRQRAYIKHVLGITNIPVGRAKGDLRPHVLLPNAKRPTTEAQVDQILAFVKTYEIRLAGFDAHAGRRAEEIALIDEIIRSMPSHLGDALASRLDAYVNDRVKRQIKIIGRGTT